MSKDWNQTRLEQYIIDGIEESLTLDYKAAASLDKSDKKKIEITKDVSAMANSAGGILIYGIAEFQDKAHEHLPERLDPVDRMAFSKEWLEHIIGNIQPRIDGVIIHPVPISSATNHVVYVVEIPQSHTAHQARDMRYYKRFNFESVMMSDYEIRDVMGRGQFPKLELGFSLEIIRAPEEINQYKINDYCSLSVTIKNTGVVRAEYITCFICLPSYFVSPLKKIGVSQFTDRNGVLCDRFRMDNFDNEKKSYVPLLPSVELSLRTLKFMSSSNDQVLPQTEMTWIVHADNAAPRAGTTTFADIGIIDRRPKEG